MRQSQKRNCLDLVLGSKYNALSEDRTNNSVVNDLQTNSLTITSYEAIPKKKLFRFDSWPHIQYT